MPTPMRRRLRITRRVLGYGGMVVLILVALLIGIAAQLLPLAEQHPDRIAAWLSERAGRPVHFSRVETDWTRRGPVLRLDALRIGDPSQSILIADTEMLVNLYAGFLPRQSFTELRLRGLDLTVERAGDGTWSVRGLPGQQQPGSDPLAALERLGELQIIGGRLHVDAPTLGIDATVPRIDLRLRVKGDRVRGGMRAWMRDKVSPLSATIDFDRKRGDGGAYVGAQDADLSIWAPLLHVMGVEVAGGRGRLQGWATLKAHRVASMTFDTLIDDVVLRGAPLRDQAGTRIPQSRFGRVEMQARLRQEAQGWRFDAPRLRIESDGSRQSLDGLLLAGGERYGLLAERVDAAPLLAAVALSDRIDAGLRRWLLLSKPTAVLERVEVVGRRGGALRANGSVSNVGFSPVGDAPGLHRLSGMMTADADGFVFTPNAGVQMAFDWPSGFAVVHPVTLRGAIAGWREGAGWRIGFDDLHIVGKNFGVRARGGMWFQNDGTRPWIDVAADLDEADIVAAKGFLVRHLMADATERWLDTALISGKLAGGHAVVSGDLDDWPFTKNNGLFRADGNLQDATIKFSPQWPAADHLTGLASFVGNGFTVDASGQLAGVGVTRLQAALPDYAHAALTIDAQGKSDASKLLDLLRHSPLNKEHGETLANIEANGAADVTFHMDLPLTKNAPPARTKGTVVLNGARLREKRWNLAFDEVRGKADYGDGGFAANGLNVRNEGAPGRLSLRAGNDYVRDRKQAFEAELDASMGTKALIDRAGNLGWLKPYVDGRSTWTVGVALPKGTGKNVAPSKLTLRSNLVGSALELPAPLRKSANVSLPTTVEADLPMGEGEVRVALGNIAAVRARSRGDQTGLRVVLGSNRVDEAPPASGLVATGSAGTLDVVDWIGLAYAGGGSDDKGGGLALRRIDLRADRLALLGGVFPDARVQVSPGANGSHVVVTGAALAGNVLVPDAKGAAISGRFERAYYRTPQKPANAPATPATPAADPSPINPKDIPPLDFDIADLRINALQLGHGVIRTRPMADGMRFDHLQTQSPLHQIAIDGAWTGTGGTARTRAALDIRSQDFGALLAGLGFGGQLEGGKGSANFDAMWPGAPREFQARGVEGLLALDVKEGTLLEIEPGAGRVLGLLSLAQLPRRMTLDFRDFYSKGLAFDRVDGHVRLAAGKARTDDLSIDGPAAQIEIRGTADLQAQTFDQTVEVLPRAGNLLIVGGALVGGPVGAAVGAAANAVLKKPLGQLAAKTYRVTGPWKDPKVEVSKRAAPATPSSRSSATADGAPNG